jgi:hypothetical protein
VFHSTGYFRCEVQYGSFTGIVFSAGGLNRTDGRNRSFIRGDQLPFGIEQ